MPKTKEQKIKFIQEHVNSVPVAIRKEVGWIVHEAGIKLHECAQGSVVNLDLLPSNTVELIYRYLKFALTAKGFDKEINI